MSVKRMYYDIETSFCQGHFWRPGWNQNILPHQITSYAKIISIHWSWDDSDKVYHLDWGLKKQCDKKMVQAFIKEMDKATEIISHNGKRFDTPWIRTRAMYHGIDMHHTYNEIDTYKLCKKYLNLPSNSLAEVCKYYGLEAKKDAGGINTWIGIVFDKDQEALDSLLYYGDGDVLSLKAVYNKIRPYVPAQTHLAVASGDAKFFCPECSSLPWHDKVYTTQHGTTYHYMKCKTDNCNTKFKVNVKNYLDYLKYKMVNGIR